MSTPTRTTCRWVCRCRVRARSARVATGVSSSLELFRRAGEAGAQMLIVHHGLFWKRDPRRIGPRQKERLRSLFDNDLSLVAYHLALDAHPEVGNNALICNALELTDLRGFGGEGERTIGFIGTAEPSISPDRLMARVRAKINPDPIAFLHGPERIRRVAVVSGGAADLVDEAADSGADAFITGEPNEPAMARAQRGRDPLRRRRPLRHRGVRSEGSGRVGGTPIWRRTPLHRHPQPGVASVDAVRPSG